MVDYSRFDKIAALLSSSDDEDEHDDPRRYDHLLKDKFNVSINKDGDQSAPTKASPKHAQPSPTHDDDHKQSHPDNPYVDDSLFAAQNDFSPTANAEYMTQHGVRENPSEIRVHDDVVDDDLDQVAEAADEAFFERHYEEIAPVFVASTAMYQRHKATHSEQVQAMATAAETISAPDSVRSEYQIEHRINQYSHSIPMDTLRLISDGQTERGMNGINTIWTKIHGQNSWSNTVEISTQKRNFKNFLQTLSIIRSFEKTQINRTHFLIFGINQQRLTR